MSHDLISRKALVAVLIKEREQYPPETADCRYALGVKFPNHFNQAMRGGIRKALRLVETAPAIDAEPVIRCKDCVHYRPEPYGDAMMCYDFANGHWPHPDDYCSHGKKKEVEVQVE